MTGGLQIESIFLYLKGSSALMLLIREQGKGGHSLQGFYDKQADVIDL